jgi:hypothetical protein
MLIDGFNFEGVEANFVESNWRRSKFLVTRNRDPSYQQPSASLTGDRISRIIGLWCSMEQHSRCGSFVGRLS